MSRGDSYSYELAEAIDPTLRATLMLRTAARAMTACALQDTSPGAAVCYQLTIAANACQQEFGWPEGDDRSFANEVLKEAARHQKLEPSLRISPEQWRVWLHLARASVDGLHRGRSLTIVRGLQDGTCRFQSLKSRVPAK